MYLTICNCAPDEAEGLAERLVSGGLAACVNIIPSVTSIYRWQGAIVRDGESTLLIKTTKERMHDLREQLREWHSYSVPEILAIPIDLSGSNDEYINWVREMTHGPAPGT